jgi:membrane protein implicated in regulation of membrane protease activity
MMSQESSRALTWLSAIILGVAILVMSPVGSFAGFVLASLCAAILSIFGANRTRIIAICFLVLSIALAVWLFPQFQRELAAYSKRAKERNMAPNQEPQLPKVNTK